MFSHTITFSNVPCVVPLPPLNEGSGMVELTVLQGRNLVAKDFNGNKEQTCN